MNKIFRILGKRGRITIPFEMRVQLGIMHNDILSFQADGNKVIVTKEKLCSNCSSSEDSKKQIIKEYIDSLSPYERYDLITQLTSQLVKNI
jgi:bifunctional DNA-binding transcriptional regulator/antitoxin component of YhaV-PrlF toxin-antitoxin module